MMVGFDGYRMENRTSVQRKDVIISNAKNKKAGFMPAFFLLFFSDPVRVVIVVKMK